MVVSGFQRQCLFGDGPHSATIRCVMRILIREGAREDLAMERRHGLEPSRSISHFRPGEDSFLVIGTRCTERIAHRSFYNAWRNSLQFQGQAGDLERCDP